MSIINYSKIKKHCDKLACIVGCLFRCQKADSNAEIL